MGGLYDILAAYRQQNEPRFIYEGLYQDPDRFLDYDDSITDFTGQADYPFTGNIPTNARARYDARAYNTDEPLPSPYGVKDGTFFEDFNPRVGIITPFQPYENPTYQMKQQVGMVPTGIMDIDTDVPSIPFGTSVDNYQGFTDKTARDVPVRNIPVRNIPFRSIPFGTSVDNYQGFTDKTARDSEEEEQNWFQKLMNNSLMAKAGGILNAIFRPKQSDRYRPATMGIGSYSPAALNQMNAMGGYYSRPAMDQRSRQNRIANMILRRDADQNYSEKNLANLQAEMSGQPSQAQFATPKAAARSPKVGVSGYTSGDVARESRRGHYG